MFQVTLNLSPANVFIFGESKILSAGKGLMIFFFQVKKLKNGAHFGNQQYFQNSNDKIVTGLTLCQATEFERDPY